MQGTVAIKACQCAIRPTGASYCTGQSHQLLNTGQSHQLLRCVSVLVTLLECETPP